jgi:mannose-1-phosphate guanylyltransferase
LLTDPLAHDPSRTAVLILAGGAGTRLWPLSTDDRPKQFLKIFGGRSLLQQTFDRVRALTSSERVFVSTNDRYAGQIAEQLPDLPKQNILVEPSRRNTGPAMAICCAEIRKRLGDQTTLASFHADNAVTQPELFVKTASRGIAYASDHEAIVTVAIKPTEPNTGFGYLELAGEVAPAVTLLRRFVEKPPLELAREFLQAGNYAWNAGMFIFRLGYFHQLLTQLQPDIASLAELYVRTEDSDRRGVYERMPSISIDHAVMEKAPRVVAVAGDFGWSDVGSWKAVAELLHGSNIARTLRSAGAFALSESDRRIAIVGVDDVAVIESERGILVLNLRDDAGLSAFIQELESD